MDWLESQWQGRDTRAAWLSTIVCGLSVCGFMAIEGDWSNQGLWLVFGFVVGVCLVYVWFANMSN